MRAEKNGILRICLLVQVVILLTVCSREIPEVDHAADVYVDSAGVMPRQNQIQYPCCILPGDGGRPESPLIIFQAESDGELVYGNSFFPLLPSRVPGETVIRMSTMNRFSEGQQSASFKFYFRDKIAGRIKDLQTVTTIRLLGYSDTGNSCNLRLALRVI